MCRRPARQLRPPNFSSRGEDPRVIQPRRYRRPCEVRKCPRRPRLLRCESIRIDGRSADFDVPGRISRGFVLSRPAATVQSVRDVPETGFLPLARRKNFGFWPGRQVARRSGSVRVCRLLRRAAARNSLSGVVGEGIVVFIGRMVRTLNAPCQAREWRSGFCVVSVQISQ